MGQAVKCFIDIYPAPTRNVGYALEYVDPGTGAPSGGGILLTFNESGGQLVQLAILAEGSSWVPSGIGCTITRDGKISIP